MKRRIRILPILIFAATLALTLKVGGILQGPELEMSTATAADSADAKAESKKSADTKQTAKAEAGEKKSSAKKTGKKKTEGVGDTFDPTSVTQAEFQVLQRLATRRAELDKLRSDLELRENLLNAAEKKLNLKLSELTNLKNKIQGLLKKHDKEQEAKLKSLVKIYESMKPKNAARIFEQLEMEILLDVVERMREAKTAPIFAAMDPSKAKSVTARLAERRALPDPEKAKEEG